MWFGRKVRGGLRCLKEHGVRYTFKQFVGKVQRKMRVLVLYTARALGLELYLKSFSRAFKMNIYQKIKIKTIDPVQGCYRRYFLGKVMKHTSNKRYAPKTPVHSGPVFYLKINRIADYTLMCIQNWLTVIFYMDGDFYFVCDNKQLEREIVSRLTFRDGDIKFMPSRRKKLKNVAKNLWTGSWEMATYAHLTPFYHAKENDIKEYWAIDGDDTMFFLYPEQTIKVLEQAQKISKENGISAFSLDMHWSQMKGKHWSLGVLYINDTVDFCNIFENVNGLDWTEPYKDIDDIFNLDWFFNYLRDNHVAKIETFYVEDCYFCHWFPNVLRYLIGGNLCYWHNKKIVYPIIKEIYQNEKLGMIDIEKCYKISINTTLEEGRKFMENEVAILYNFTPKARRAFGLGDYGVNSIYYLPF